MGEWRSPSGYVYLTGTIWDRCFNLTNTDQEILPGLRLLIHIDAIDDGTVKFLDDLGIDIPFDAKPDKDGWILIDSVQVAKLTSARRSLDVTTYVGGGHYTVRSDPEKKQFPFSSHAHLDRKRAEREARLHAVKLFSKKNDEKETEKETEKKEKK